MVENNLPPLPYIPDEIFELMHEFSLFLLKDDKSDIGYYKYFKRNGHYYHGVKSMNHPSMIHHWQIGIAGLIVAQIGGLINMARDSMNGEIPDDEPLFEESQIIDLDESHVHYEDKKPAALPDLDIPLPPPII